MALILVLLAVAFPEIAPQALRGTLWTGMGFLMFLRPPEVRIPRIWACLAMGFVGLSLVGFLPLEWFHIPAWRKDLGALGLDTRGHAFLQPLPAIEAMVGFAATAATALFLLGHRVDSRIHQRLVLGFSFGIALWAVAALLTQKPLEEFGFFPNRNHTATLLAMGALAALGSFAQAIRLKSAGKIILSALPIGVCLYALHTASDSRAGVVLIGLGFGLWTILSGLRHLRGNVGKAVILILIATGGTFLIVDSTAKTRLTATVEQLSLMETTPLPASSPEGSVVPPEPVIDGRITIFQDTWEMVRHEIWTGVGPRQFVQVFPQYRKKTHASAEATCLHPESDWLMMLVEVGWPATLCLVSGVILVFFASAQQAKRDRARFLRMGSLAASLILCLHGIFDVPGHCVGLAWAAALLLAVSFRSPAIEDSASTETPSHFSRQCWRGLGLILSLTGLPLIYAEFTEQRILPTVQVAYLKTEIKALYDANRAAYDEATRNNLDYESNLSQGPLHAALQRVNDGLKIAPLDPQLHCARGVIHLCVDGNEEIVRQAFAIERRLLPFRVNLPLEQTRFWTLNPRETPALWAEALRRAAIEETHIPDTYYSIPNTYRNILGAAGKDETLAAAAFELARNSPNLLDIWANQAPPSALDQQMTDLLTSLKNSNDRNKFFKIWQKRGSIERVTRFIQERPEFGRPEF